MTKNYIFLLHNPTQAFVGSNHNLGLEIFPKAKLEDAQYENNFAFKTFEDVTVFWSTRYSINDSGKVLFEVINFFDISKKNTIFVSYDDFDVLENEVKFRNGVSSNIAHNGIRSIIANVKTYKFNIISVRIGFGFRRKGGEHLRDIVLGKINASNQANSARLLMNIITNE